MTREIKMIKIANFHNFLSSKWSNNCR